MTKREVIDRIAVLDAEIAAREDERRMLRELLVEWPDGAETLHALDGELDDTLPGVPKTKSSQKLRVVKPPEEE